MDKSCSTCADWPRCNQQKKCKVWGGEYGDRRVVELRLWKERKTWGVNMTDTLRPNDWETKTKEWKEAYPRVMRWAEVPEDRKVNPEFILFYRGDYGKYEAENLSKREHGCEMAIDYGSRWGRRLGVYARCGMTPAPGEKLCHCHGGELKLNYAKGV